MAKIIKTVFFVRFTVIKTGLKTGLPMVSDLI